MNLKKIKPHESTHGGKWVYATKDKIMAAAFLSGKGGDFSCCIGRDPKTNFIYICERFKNAFEYRYNNIIGSIYTLSSKNFKCGMTCWDEEVISENEENVLNEIKICDAAEYLTYLCKESKLLITRYPQKIDEIPEDDEDLVERAVLWYNQHGEKIIDKIKKYHPHLYDRVMSGINS